MNVKEIGNVKESCSIQVYDLKNNRMNISQIEIF